MRLPARIRSGARENRGGVLVLVALFAPVAVLFCAFVIDLGNGWWHQRHLQVQADAAALAAAQDLAAPSCSDSAASADAQAYGGVAAAGSYNIQVGGTSASNVHQLINSPTFYGQSSPVDSTVATGSPCSSNMVDVKMTETNLPFFLPVFSSAFNGFSNINAQARVELRQETVSAGEAPIAVNDVSFRYAEAYFVDETPGNVGTQIGQGVPLSDTNTVNAAGLEVWASTGAASLAVPNEPAPTGSTHPDADVGVRIALAGATKPTGSLATDCGPTGSGGPAGTMCFDGSGPNAQLLDVHGFPTTGTGSPTSPVNHGVIMTPIPGGCGDQYFAYTGTTTGTCADGLRATLDLGTVPAGATVAVSAKVGGTSYALKQTNCPAGTAPAAPLSAWCTDAAGLQAANGARTSVDVQVVYTPAGKNPTPVTTTFSNAQSTYVGSGKTTTSGPIQALTLSATSAAACSLTGSTPPCSDTSALPEGTASPVTVTLGVTPRLSIASPNPLVTMRLNNVGSQNQTVDCGQANQAPPGSPNFDTWSAQLAFGCKGPFGVNPTLACPDTTVPVDCVNPQPGDATSKVPGALNWRILCQPQAPNITNCNGGNGKPSACISPNHWPNYQQGDPRIVQVFITPYGSFGGSGQSTQFPIEAFAAFYVTGWQGQGSSTNPCQPSSGGTDDTAASGTMVGHFIHYVQLDGSGSTQTCVAGSVDECVAVMTR